MDDSNVQEDFGHNRSRDLSVSKTSLLHVDFFWFLFVILKNIPFQNSFLKISVCKSIGNFPEVFNFSNTTCLYVSSGQFSPIHCCLVKYQVGIVESKLHKSSRKKGMTLMLPLV